MVLEKVSTDGLMATVDAVKSKLDQPLALGYCHVGQIIEVGQETIVIKLANFIFITVSVVTHTIIKTLCLIINLLPIARELLRFYASKSAR
jgi:hypothetical protein